MKKKSAKIEEKKGVFHYNPVFRNLTGDKELTNQREVPVEKPAHRRPQRAVADDVIGFALNEPHRRCGPSGIFWWRPVELVHSGRK